MIAIVPQTVPQAHHNLAKPIITLNSPKAIITAYLQGRYANAVRWPHAASWRVLVAKVTTVMTASTIA